MKDLHTGDISNAATPLNSAGYPTQGYGNAAGGFNLKNTFGPRKVKSRKDLDQPKKEGYVELKGDTNDSAIERYFGSFSIESKRNVRDLLKTHPLFGESDVRLNRVKNNTRKVLSNDPTITVENGGHIVFQNVPQASE